MVDSASVTESCIPVGDVDRHGQMSSTVTEVLRSSLSPKLRMALPPEALSASMQQPLPLTNLWQQRLQIASTQADRGQVLVDMAAAIGKAFNVDGCAIVLPEPFPSSAQVACWLADAPSLPLHPFKTAPDLFEDGLTHGAIQDHVELATVETATVATVPSPRASTSRISKFLQLWQLIETLRAPLIQVKAVLSTTMQWQGQVNGVISFMRSRAHVWTQAEIAGLQTVSHQVASTIDQLRLQEQHNKQRAYQQVVNQLTLAIHNASNLTDILKLATEGTAQALQMQRGMLLRLKYWDVRFRDRTQTPLPTVRVTVDYEWLNDAMPEALVHLQPPSTPSTPDAAMQAHPSFWLSECTLCQQAFLQPNRPTIIASQQSAQSDQGFIEVNYLDANSRVAAAFHLESLPTLLLAPLESQGNILGFLVFQHEQARIWQSEELELVQLVSAQVSTAIIQTETLRQVQSLVEKRTAELRESLSVQAKLYDRTRYQLDQLQQLNQVKDDFLSTVSHELRTPLTSMTMAIRMLRQVGLSDDRRDRYLDILEQQCAQETSLINDLLGLQELESNQIAMSLQEIDLKELLHDLARLFHQKWLAKGLTLEAKLPRRSLRLLSDRDSLHRILIELLTNAGKYADPNSCVHLNVALKDGALKDAALKAGSATDQPATNQIILTLCNTGQGIAPDELPLIFDKFKRCQGANQNAIQGTGLGLALVKSLVLHLNGSISADSYLTDDATYETCFTLTLPQTFSEIRSLEIRL